MVMMTQVIILKHCRIIIRRDNIIWEEIIEYNKSKNIMNIVATTQVKD